MIGASSFLLLKPAVQTERTGQNSAPGTPHSLRAEHLPLTPSHRMKGIGVSMGIGFLSSFLGIGGGILNVLMMLYLLEFPVHIATATSQFILAMTALVGAGTHVTTGELGEGIHQVIPLAIGVIVGAQMGARLSVRLHGAWIVRALALALGVAGLRFVLSVLMSA
jgi:hypothetical protein